MRPSALAAFRRDRRASASLETALVMIPFLMLLMMVLGGGVQLFAYGAMDAGVRKAARQIRIGAIRGASDAAVRDLVCTAMSGLAGTCANLQVYATSGAGFAALSPATITGSALSRSGFSPGVAGNYVVLQVAFTAPALLPLPTMMNNTFLSTISFRNEP